MNKVTNTGVQHAPPRHGERTAEGAPNTVCTVVVGEHDVAVSRRRVILIEGFSTVNAKTKGL